MGAVTKKTAAKNTSHLTTEETQRHYLTLTEHIVYEHTHSLSATGITTSLDFSGAVNQNKGEEKDGMTFQSLNNEL